MLTGLSLNGFDRALFISFKFPMRINLNKNAQKQEGNSRFGNVEASKPASSPGLFYGLLPHEDRNHASKIRRTPIGSKQFETN